MIEALTNYTYLIIITSFFINIIQMILPNGETKKYIFFVASLIVTIILVEPILKFVNGDVDVEKIFTLNQEESLMMVEENSNEMTNKIFDTYKSNVENDIIKRLNDSGYEVHSIKCEYDDETMEPKFLHLEISNYDGEIRPVKIEVSTTNSNSVSKIDEWKIQKDMKDTYGFEEVVIEEWKSY